MKLNQFNVSFKARLHQFAAVLLLLCPVLAAADIYYIGDGYSIAGTQTSEGTVTSTTGTYTIR